MFLDTLAISNQSIETAIKKVTCGLGIITADQKEKIVRPINEIAEKKKN